MEKQKKTWHNIMTSNSSLLDFEEHETITRILFINVTAALGFFLSLILLIIKLNSNQFPTIYFYLIIPLFFLAIIVILRITGNTKLCSAMMMFFLILTVPPGILSDGNAGIIYPFFYPLIAFYLYGRRKGLFWILFLLLVYGAMIVLAYFKIIAIPYSFRFSLFCFFELAVISAFIYLLGDREDKILDLIKKQVYYDPLTGLANQALLLRHISEARSPALLLLNIDDFKEVNATYGYQAGNSVLCYTAEKIKQIVPDSIKGVYKLGADEFAVLIDKEEEESRFRKKLINIANIITRFLRHDKCNFEDVEIIIRTTMGIALADEEGIEKLFACANIALKTAKRINKAFLFYDEALKTKERYKENIKWANILSDALDNHRIVPYYQPIFNNETSEIEKYECLVRLIDIEGQIISPKYFLNIAKKSRLYTKITKMVLRKAFEFLKNNSAEVSINLSVEDILDQTVLGYINKLLTENPSLKSRVCFEITETEGFENFDQVSQFIGEMKKMGCKIAIDDFGTGYSNFEYLMHLKVDYLKIDGSLIKNINQDTNSRLIVENIVAFSNSMGIKTIAEFVHSIEIFEEVKTLKINYSQGYYFGEPKPAKREISVEDTF